MTAGRGRLRAAGLLTLVADPLVAQVLALMAGEPHDPQTPGGCMPGRDLLRFSRTQERCSSCHRRSRAGTGFMHGFVHGMPRDRPRRGETQKTQDDLAP